MLLEGGGDVPGTWVQRGPFSPLCQCALAWATMLAAKGPRSPALVAHGGFLTQAWGHDMQSCPRSTPPG